MMAKGDKSLNEEYKEWYRTALEKLELNHHKEWFTNRYNPDKPVNQKQGTCPWCGEKQAQIGVLQKEDHSELGEYDRYSKYLPYTKARVCLTCGRVELIDSKPEGSTTHA